MRISCGLTLAPAQPSFLSALMEGVARVDIRTQRL